MSTETDDPASPDSTTVSSVVPPPPRRARRLPPAARRRADAELQRLEAASPRVAAAVEVFERLQDDRRASEGRARRRGEARVSQAADPRHRAFFHHLGAASRDSYLAVPLARAMEGGGTAALAELLAVVLRRVAHDPVARAEILAAAEAVRRLTEGRDERDGAAPTPTADTVAAEPLPMPCTAIAADSDPASEAMPPDRPALVIAGADESAGGPSAPNGTPSTAVEPSEDVARIGTGSAPPQGAERVAVSDWFADFVECRLLYDPRAPLGTALSRRLDALFPRPEPHRPEWHVTTGGLEAAGLGGTAGFASLLALARRTGGRLEVGPGPARLPEAPSMRT